MHSGHAKPITHSDISPVLGPDVAPGDTCTCASTAAAETR